MHSAIMVLRNAAQWCRVNNTPHNSTIGIWRPVTSPSLSQDTPHLADLSSSWKPESFWVPDHVASGFPLLVCPDDSEADAWATALDARGVANSVCRFADIGAHIFKNVTIAVHPRQRSYYYSGPILHNKALADWLAVPRSMGDNHSSAYDNYVNMPLGRNEDTLGVLGADVWADLRQLQADFAVRGAVDQRTWSAFWHLIGVGKVAEAVRVGDLGVPLEAAATHWVDDCGPRPIRRMSTPLWHRELRHKRRHYFDVASLFKVTSDMWHAHGQGPAFDATAKQLLLHAVCSGMQYERLYLTMFWLWTSPYWVDLARYVLATNMLYATDAEWRAACKETTAQVTRSWFFPLTNQQTIASAYFLNAEDLVGYPDADPNAGAISLEILQFATDNFSYSYPTSENRTFDAYLRQFSYGVESLLEPMYAEFAGKSITYAEALDTRVAWAASGVSGRRAREVLGPDVAPAGSSKGYVMAKSKRTAWERSWGTTFVETAPKGDERGTTRPISATDMRDQFAEQIVFKPVHNRFPLVGLDIGESPEQACTRHLNLLVASEGPDHYQHDGKTLMCWDWQAWDHYVHCLERRMMLEAMERLTDRYVQGQARADIKAELVDLLAGTDELIYRSQSFADERYSAEVDAIIAASGGRAARMADHAGRFAVSVRMPNGQQSGRMSTLDSNTIIGTSRLLVRDAELLGRTANLSHRTSMYVCNRADDVAEVFASMRGAVAAVQTMLDQGHRANPKKQVVQVRSMVYLRNLYANGSLRAFPARSTYAAATSHPDKGAGSEASYIDKLRSVSKGLDMWMRRGGWMEMARALYDDALRFFSATRVWLGERAGGGRNYVKVRVDPLVIEAAPEHGGLGILAPGVYEHNYAIKCSPKRYWADIGRHWRSELDRFVRKLVRGAPGVAELEVHARNWFERDTGIVTQPDHRKRFRVRWARARVHQSGDGQTRFVERQADVAFSVKHVHVDRKDTPVEVPAMGLKVIEAMRLFDVAHGVARQALGSRFIKQTLSQVRGKTGYGILGHEWYGYGDVVVREGARAGQLVPGDPYFDVVSATKPGADFLATSQGWPALARRWHLEGNLGMAGSWDKLLPPSFSGFCGAALQYCLEYAFDRYGSRFSTSYAILKLRARLTHDIVSSFYTRHQELFLH